MALKLSLVRKNLISQYLYTVICTPVICTLTYHFVVFDLLDNAAQFVYHFNAIGRHFYKGAVVGETRFDPFAVDRDYAAEYPSA